MHCRKLDILAIAVSMVAFVGVGLVGCGPDGSNIEEGDTFVSASAGAVSVSAGVTDVGMNGTTDDVDGGETPAGPPCWEDGPAAKDPGCSVDSCPSPDNSKDPELTCSAPLYAPELTNTTVHLYGKYLVNEDGPPTAVIYREVDEVGDVPEGFGGRPPVDDVTVVSNCHVKVELNLSTTHSNCGDVYAFRLQRQRQSETDRNVGHKGIVSGWRYLRISKE